MPWIDRADHWLPPMRDRRPAAHRPPEDMYSVRDVADILHVSKQTVYKWLSLDAPDDAVIAPDDWVKLPGSGHIRIFRRAIDKLQSQLS